MKSSLAHLATHTRSLVAAALSATVLVITLGVAVPSAHALGTSKFCTALFSYVEKGEKVFSETPTSVNSYHIWAKDLLPYYQTLEADAPNAATKTELGYVVTILQYAAHQASLAKIEAYTTANHAKFEAGAKALANAIKACA